MANLNNALKALEKSMQERGEENAKGNKKKAPAAESTSQSAKMSEERNEPKEPVQKPKPEEQPKEEVKTPEPKEEAKKPEPQKEALEATQKETAPKEPEVKRVDGSTIRGKKRTLKIVAEQKMRSPSLIDTPPTKEETPIKEKAEKPQEKTEAPQKEKVEEGKGVPKEQTESEFNKTQILGADIEPDRPPVLIGNGNEIVINKPRFRIGKEKGYNDLDLADNPTVSRRHAEIIHRDGAYYIRDNGSTNGTFVDEQKVPKLECLLVDGAKIRFSDAEYVFRR